MLSDPRPQDTHRDALRLSPGRDPARVANAAWIAHQTLAEYRKPADPIARLEARIEALEAELYRQARNIQDAVETADHAEAVAAEANERAGSLS